jgi:hypothetical protein
MQKLLTAALVLTSLLFAQMAQAEDNCQTAMTKQETAAPASEPVVISWDRVGSKEKWWA